MTEPPQSPPLGCAYVGQYHLGQFQRDLSGIVEAGIQRLYLPMTEEDLELRQPNLKAMASMASQAGLEAWLIPWGVGAVFGGPPGAQFVAQYLDARQIDSAGQSLPAACPNNPRFIHFMENWLHSAAEAGAHGVLWDQPAWARHAALPQYRDMDTSRLWACCCEHCRRRFLALHRCQDWPEEPDDDVRDFRARAMAAFLRDMGEAALRRGMKSSLWISPYGALTTWETLARQPWIAEISASAFWVAPSAAPQAEEDDPFLQFQRQTEAAWDLLRRLQELSHGARVFFWLRCFQVAQRDERLIFKAVAHLRSLGAKEFAVWPFGGAASLGALASERPHEAWRATLKALKAE